MPDQTEGPKRPLNQSERNALKQLINDDFGALWQELHTTGQEFKAARRAEIQAEFAAKEPIARAAERELEKMSRAFSDKLNAKIEQLGEKGVTPVAPQPVNLHWRFQPVGLQEALANAEAEISTDLQRAQSNLERQRVQAQRQVLLAGIVSTEALKLVESMPSARELLMQAQSQSEDRKQLNA